MPELSMFEEPVTHIVLEGGGTLELLFGHLQNEAVWNPVIMPCSCAGCWRKMRLSPLQVEH